MSKKKAKINKLNDIKPEDFKDFSNVMGAVLDTFKNMGGFILENKLWADVLKEARKRNSLNDIATAFGGRKLSKSFKYTKTELNHEQKATLEQGLKDMFMQNKKHVVIFINSLQFNQVKDFVIECVKKELGSGYTIRVGLNQVMHIIFHNNKISNILIHLTDPLYIEKEFFKSHHDVDLLIAICDEMPNGKFLSILKEWLKNLRSKKLNLVVDIQAQIIQLLEKQESELIKQFTMEQVEHHKTRYTFVEQLKEVKKNADDAEEYLRNEFKKLEKHGMNLQDKVKTQEQVIDSIGCLFSHAQEIYRSYKSGNNKE